MAPILPPTSVVSVWRQFTLKYQEKSFCKLYEIKASRWWHWWWRCTVSGHVQEQVRCLCVHLQFLSFQSVTLLYRIRDCNALLYVFLKQSIVCGYWSMKFLWRRGLRQTPRGWPINVCREETLLLFSLWEAKDEGTEARVLAVTRPSFHHMGTGQLHPSQRPFAAVLTRLPMS